MLKSTITLFLLILMVFQPISNFLIEYYPNFTKKVECSETCCTDNCIVCCCLPSIDVAPAITQCDVNDGILINKMTKEIACYKQIVTAGFIWFVAQKYAPLIVSLKLPFYKELDFPPPKKGVLA